MHIDIVSLQRQIQQNCHVSDANFSGVFSLCGLLLRLRDLYKWEANLPPWAEPEQGALLGWIERRENLWQELKDQECRPLAVAKKVIPPFEAAKVNCLLAAHGLLYGAGYGIGMKPSFFLAEPVRSIPGEGLWVHTVERELARDIFTTPVMRQGDQIVARRHAMAAILWDMVQEQQASVAPALGYALAGYGLKPQSLLRNPEASSRAFSRMIREELDVLVHHEIGEAKEDVFPDDLWQQMIAVHNQTLVEIFLRSVKDLLADTHPQGLLGHIIADQRDRSLGLYLAMLRPIAKILLPEAGQMSPAFLSSCDWAEVDRIRRAGYRKGRELALNLADLHLAGDVAQPHHIQRKITAEIIRPLGILGLSEDSEHVAA